MALQYFIPTVWSETLYRELDKEYIGVKNCSRDFEGDIKKMGDTVKILGVGPVSVFDYTKNQDMTAPEELTDSESTLIIDQAKGFNFLIDDIDTVQSSPKLMQEAMHRAASALSDAADNYIYGLYSKAEAGNVITQAALSGDNVLDLLLKTRQKLMENNVPGSEEIMLEVPPAVASVILKAKVLYDTSNSEMLEKGCLGSFMGFRVFVSNNIKTSGGNYQCFARTKRALSFAEQINEVEAYRPEKRFADAVRGLHLYGAKIVYPKELFVLSVKVA